MTHRTSGKGKGMLLFCLTLVLILMCASLASAATKNILILNAYHNGYKWSDDITRGVQSVVDEKKAKLYIDFLDTKRNPGEAYTKNLDELYKTKFRNVSFDVIVTSDDDALNFMKRNRDKLFPNTPVVFTGVNWYIPEKTAGHKLMTGVNEDADAQATIDLMLQLHPATKKIYVVVDTTTTGNVVVAKMNQVTPKYKGKVEFIYLQDLEMEKILETVSKLGADSLVLMTVFQKDRAGNFFEFSESTELVSQKSSVPMYGLWDFNLGFGIVGGMLTSGEEQGKAGGQMVNRILKGESADAIPVLMESPNKYMFDYKQLSRFGIDRAKLPPKSRVINEPGANYSMSKGTVWMIGGFMIFITLGFAYFIYKRL
jgi:ABC-type uncharacterized transport system substrate-binding protein